MFNDDATRLKLVTMRQAIDSSIVRLSAYRTHDMNLGTPKIEFSSEPEPLLKKMELEYGSLFLWRTPWCLYKSDQNIWIPILDSDQRSRIPGQFLYDSTPSRYYEGIAALRAAMLSEIRGPIARIAPQTPANKPPRFVCEIIKRDAIANKTACSISLADITEETKALITPCFHLYDAESLRTWIRIKGLCAMCKAPISEEDCLEL